MSDTVIKIIGVLLFALAAAFLYGWGVIKSQNQQKELYEILNRKAATKIKKYLKSHAYITYTETQEQVSDIKASQFYSRNRAMVQDKKEFSRKLLASMVEQKILIEDMVQGKKVYRLRKEI
ncbi:MAG: hypothetical protein PHN80_05095 [Hespellia sp.]|nr:hypothetical protein [Hespellia sp.]